MQQAIEFLTSAANLPFAVALVLMLLIGLVEAAGLSGLTAPVDVDAGDGWLTWLGLGTVPLLIVFVVFLALFGTAGLIVQQIAVALSGMPLPWSLASIAAAGAAMPLTGASAKGLARILPRDETTAVFLESLVGRVGRITTGTAQQGSPARARVEDRHGQAHFVMVEPANAGQTFQEGETVILVHRDAQLFHGVAYDNPLLPRLDP